MTTVDNILVKSNCKQFVGVQFIPNDPSVDFEQMIIKTEYNNCLFIYNENIDDYISKSLTSGGGNAIIRPYRMDSAGSNNPRALGIPTGLQGGFNGLHDKYYEINAQEFIDCSINVIDDALQKNPHIKRIYWSIDENGFIGTGIFKVSTDVKLYITESLRNIAKKYNYNTINILDKLHDLSNTQEHIVFKEVDI